MSIRLLAGVIKPRIEYSQKLEQLEYEKNALEQYDQLNLPGDGNAAQATKSLLAKTNEEIAKLHSKMSGLVSDILKEYPDWMERLGGTHISQEEWAWQTQLVTNLGTQWNDLIPEFARGIEILEERVLTLEQRGEIRPMDTDTLGDSEVGPPAKRRRLDDREGSGEGEGEGEEALRSRIDDVESRLETLEDEHQTLQSEVSEMKANQSDGGKETPPPAPPSLATNLAASELVPLPSDKRLDSALEDLQEHGGHLDKHKKEIDEIRNLISPIIVNLKDFDQAKEESEREIADLKAEVAKLREVAMVYKKERDASSVLVDTLTKQYRQDTLKYEERLTKVRYYIQGC